MGSVLVGPTLAACGPSIAWPTGSIALIAVPTLAPPRGSSPQACVSALLTGDLAADQRWGVVVAPPDGGPAIKVIWPIGYAGQADARGSSWWTSPRTELRSRASAIGSRSVAGS